MQHQQWLQHPQRELQHLRSAFGRNGNDILEGKVALQDITRKYKEMNCVDKENLVGNNDLIETVEFENLTSQDCTT